MPLPLGDIEDKYQLLHKLAEGGMGEVYKVRHRLLDEIRVIKVVNPVHAANDKARRRFEQEARAATQLRHPNIAQIFDFVTTEKSAYLVMEFIDGATFKQILKTSGPQPLGLTLEMARQSLEALGYLHEQGYLHRDVAPDNLMLCVGPGGQPSVKLIDLGLAKRPEDRIDLTGTNMFVGKVRYSSPEIFRNSGEAASPTSDLYSFGVVLYELLTGACPFSGSTFEELATGHLLEPPLGFEKTDPQGRVPEGLREIVLQVLDKRPQGRPESAGRLAALLSEFAESGPWSLPTLDGESERSTADDSTIDAPNPLSEKRGPEQLEVAEETISQTADVEQTLHDVPSGRHPKRGKLWPSKLARWLGLMVALVGLTGGAWWWLGRASEPPLEVVPSAPALGRLLIDATPWARITSVKDSAGRIVKIGETLDTPAVLDLPVGEYEILLEHPDFPPSDVLRATVPVAGTARISARLGELAVDDYFAVAGLGETLTAAGSVQAGEP